MHSLSTFPISKMNRILKYPLNIQSATDIEIPNEPLSPNTVYPFGRGVVGAVLFVVGKVVTDWTSSDVMYVTDRRYVASASLSWTS